MNISKTGIDLIKRWEGFRDNAYQCAAGVWTLGFGHTRGVKEGDHCTLSQAEQWLMDDISNAENAVNRYIPIYHWNQNQYDALVSFTYNCGAGNLRLLLLNGAKPLAQVEKDILLYNKAAGKYVQGLQNRRNAEHALFIKPVSASEYYPAYNGSSQKIDEIFMEIGASDSYDMKQAYMFQRRQPIAKANGISNYTGTLQQNLNLISLAKAGKLRRP